MHTIFASRRYSSPPFINLQQVCVLLAYACPIQSHPRFPDALAIFPSFVEQSSWILGESSSWRRRMRLNSAMPCRLRRESQQPSLAVGYPFAAHGHAGGLQVVKYAWGIERSLKKRLGSGLSLTSTLYFTWCFYRSPFADRQANEGRKS